MPTYDQNPADEAMKVRNTSFNYSAVRISDLGASEYTLVGIVSDNSPSVGPYRNEMEKCIQTAIEACRLSPRANNLLLRHTIFSSDVNQNHGWKMLADLNIADYERCLAKFPSSMTALNLATHEAVEVMRDYGEQLAKAKFSVNGVLFIITDGRDNLGGVQPAAIAKVIDKIRSDEKLESLVTILVGVALGEAGVRDELESFQKEAGITQFVELKDANKSSLGKLAAFISKSISAQSQSLGTGGPSKALTSGQLSI